MENQRHTGRKTEHSFLAARIENGWIRAIGYDAYLLNQFLGSRLYINKKVFHSGIPFKKLKYFSNLLSDNRISYVVTQNGRIIAEYYPETNCYNSRKQEFQKY